MVYSTKTSPPPPRRPWSQTLKHPAEAPQFSRHRWPHDMHLKKLVIGSSALRICTWKKAASSPSQPSLGHWTLPFCALSQAPGPPKTSSRSLRSYWRREKMDEVMRCWKGQVRHSRRLVRSSVSETVRMLAQSGQTVRRRFALAHGSSAEWLCWAGHVQVALTKEHCAGLRAPRQASATAARILKTHLGRLCGCLCAKYVAP